MPNPFTKVNRIGRHLSTTSRVFLLRIYKYFFGSLFAHRTKIEWVEMNTSHPLSSSILHNKGISSPQIGVGVYQGEFVVIRQSSEGKLFQDYPVIYKMSPHEFHLLPYETPKVLIQLAHFVWCEQRLYIRSKNLQNKNGLSLSKHCPYVVQFEQHEPTSVTYEFAVKTQTKKCKVIEQALKNLEQSPQCPFDEIVDDSN